MRLRQDVSGHPLKGRRTPFPQSDPANRPGSKNIPGCHLNKPTLPEPDQFGARMRLAAYVSAQKPIQFGTITNESLTRSDEIGEIQQTTKIYHSVFQNYK